MAVNLEQEFLDHINRHKGIIHRICRMYTDTRESEEDLSQEILIQLWKSYAKFKNDSHFSTWMYKVALNTAITFFKKEQRSKVVSALNDKAEVEVETDYKVKEERLQLFYAAVYSLNNIEKALIFLYLEGQFHKEIAEHLGISEGNARVKLARTRDKLQAIIKQTTL